jgi:FkbM family methyltransferase
MGWKRKTYELLNRRGCRLILAAAGSIYTTLRARKLCRISFEHAWIHKYPAAILVEPEVILPLDSELANASADAWTYRYRPCEGDVIVDVGAGTGWDTLYFSHRVGAQGKVISIEAHPRSFLCLRRMCLLNHLENVILLNCAVTDTESTVLISDRVAYHANTIVGEQNGIQVRGHSLDDIVSTLALPRVDFLKMNIEGAERLAIAGMSKMIQKTRCVCIACHDFLADRGQGDQLRSKAEIMNFLDQHGFRVETRGSDVRPHIRDVVYGYNDACCAR